MISDNPDVSLGMVDCSLYTRRIALKDDYHKERMAMLVITHVEFDYLDYLAKTFIIVVRQNHFIRENVFNKPPVRRIAAERNTKCIYWIVHIKSILVSTIWSQTN